MPALEFKVDLSAFTGFFGDALRKMDNLQPVHEDIGKYLVPHVQDNFRTQGGAENWAPLKESTLTKKRLTYGRTPLLKTLTLLRSITHDAHEAFVDVGSRLPGARALFRGFPQRNLVARSPFEFLTGVLEPIGDMYARFVLGVH